MVSLNCAPPPHSKQGALAQVEQDTLHCWQQLMTTMCYLADNKNRLPERTTADMQQLADVVMAGHKATDTKRQKTRLQWSDRSPRVRKPIPTHEIYTVLCHGTISSFLAVVNAHQLWVNSDGCKQTGGCTSGHLSWDTCCVHWLGRVCAVF